MEIMEWFNRMLYTSWLSESGLWYVFLMAAAILVIAFVVVTVLWLRALWFVALWLFLLLPGILILAIWPDLLVWLVPWAVVAVLALIIGTALRRRGLGTLLTVIATVLALLGGIFGLGLVPTPGDPVKCVVSQGSSTPGVHLYFFDTGKQTGGSFGTPVVNTAGDQATFDELQERRSCDPYLAAAHAEAYGIIPEGSKNQFAARFNASASLWGQYNAQMEEMDNKRVSATVIDVPAGTSSWYMALRPDGTIWIHDGSTAFDGTALIITFADGSTVSLRLECGFQPVFDTPPVNPHCPSSWGPGCLEPKEASLAPAVINDGGPIHQVGTGTESTEFQADSEGDALIAEEEAAADNKADEDAHEEEIADDVVVEDTTIIISTPVPLPPG
ncbi:MAG: hypothetical protein WAO28_01580 [Candidatus Microsaccharimonas sp.]